MERMNIDELKPGRELDALIAERVMGLERVTTPGGFTVGWRPKGINLGAAPLDSYSTDIAAAWQVVEKLKWAEPELQWNDEEQCWYLFLAKCSPEQIAPSSASAPHAICLAALKAVGEKG